MIQISKPQHWPDYELIDSGNFEKIERYGKYIIRRPEPQAVWSPHLSSHEWAKLAHATFKRNTKSSITSNISERGEWIQKPEMPDQWVVHYRYKTMNLAFRLGLTGFKHLGLFPEQAANWDYIFDTITSFKSAQEVSVLNTFAYTGGASLAARSAGAEVYHVEAVRPVVSWAKDNMERSQLTDIRWVVEDVLKYLRREVKRGRKYAGIVMDPPAYGRGPNGEKWVLEEHIAELMSLSAKLLREKDSFLLLNLYSMGFSSIVAYHLLRSYFPECQEISCGELVLEDRQAQLLPLSVYARMRR